jgi:hypothetical protein
MSGGYRSPTGIIGIQSTGAIVLSVDELEPGDLVVLVNRGPRLTCTTLAALAQYLAGGSGLVNDGGVLTTTSQQFPQTNSGLEPGAVWSNGGVINVVLGYTPIPVATTFNEITVSALLTTGAIPLTTTAPPSGSGLLYIVGVEIWIA